MLYFFQDLLDHSDQEKLRELLLKNKIIEIYDTASPFEAMVDTGVILVQKSQDEKNYAVVVKDGGKIYLILQYIKPL
jgi:hypothetical protein